METSTEQASAKPEMGEIYEEYQWCVTQRSTDYADRVKRALDTRFALWPGQHHTERKWTADQPGQRIFPWPGASDIRARLVDTYVRQDVAMLMNAWRQMRTVASPIESNDSALGIRLSQLLRWTKYSQMTESRREARLFANLFIERGAAVMGVFWDRVEQMAVESITIAQINSMATMAQQALETGRRSDSTELMAQIPGIILDQALEDQAVDLGQAFLPDGLSRERIRKVVRDLREAGEAKYPVPVIVRDRPTMSAFALNEELFLPPDFSAMDTCRCVFWRELVTETTLRERERTRDWEEGFVDELARVGRGVVSDAPIEMRRQAGQTLNFTTDTSKCFELVHAYRRLHDEDGVPQIWYTVFAPALKTRTQDGALYASHEILNYNHGRYPFVLIEREVLSRNPDDSRGYGEVGAGFQRAVKVQWDSRVDRTSMATLPPGFAPPGQGIDFWEPGSVVETSRPDAYGFLDVPKYDIGSKEIEETIRGAADEYFGRQVKDRDPVPGQLIRQDLANTWFDAWVEIDTMILQLCQQFMPDEFYFRVIGTMSARPIRTTRQEIQGKFDVSISYATQNFDPELLKSKMDLINTMLTMDTQGTVDRAELLSVVAEMVEPNIGERVIRDPQHARSTEIADEKAVFSQLMSGVQVDILPGQDYRLRKQVLESLVLQNPTGRERYARDGQVRTVVDARIKQFQQQLDQQQNKLTGVYGAPPSQQGPQSFDMLAAVNKP